MQLPKRVVGVQQAGRTVDACVIDQRVKAAVALNRLLDDAVPMARLADIVRDKEAVDFLSDSLAVGVDVSNDDLCSLAREEPCRGGALTPGCAGDYRHFIPHNSHIQCPELLPLSHFGRNEPARFAPSPLLCRTSLPAKSFLVGAGDVRVQVYVHAHDDTPIVELEDAAKAAARRLASLPPDLLGAYSLSRSLDRKHVP